MVNLLHRKGKTFVDNGQALVFDPQTQEFSGVYLSQKAGGALRIRAEVRSKLTWYKEDFPTRFKELAEQIAIELVRYLTVVNGGEPVELSQVYQEGAYLLKVSPETIKRYIFAHTAMHAELYRIGKKVKVNPNYKPEEDEDEPTAGGA